MNGGLPLGDNKIKAIIIMDKRQFLQIYGVVTVLFVADILAYWFGDLSLAGAYADKVLFWIWLLYTLLVIGIYFSRVWVKWYSGFLGLLLVLSWLPMMMPFAALLGFALTEYSGYKVDDRYRVQKVHIFPVSKPVVQIIRNFGILEQVVDRYEFSYFDLDQLRAVKNLTPLGSDSLRFEFEFESDGELVRLVLPLKEQRRVLPDPDEDEK
jgi:hypothetical protein